MLSFAFGKINKCSRFKAARGPRRAGSTFYKAPALGQVFSMIKCIEVVNLKFVVIDRPRGVLIENNSACTYDIGQSAGVNADRKKRSPKKSHKKKPKTYTKSLTCKWFAVVVPERHNEITESIIQCITSGVHD